MSQAAWKRSGPIAPLSNGLMKMPSGGPRRSRSRFVLRVERGRPAQIFPVHRQHVEGAELDFVVLFARMQRAEIGHAVDTEDHGLAINDELAAAVLQRSLSDPREAFCPVIAAARDQPYPVAVALDAKAVSVKFSFVKPLRACRHGFTVGGQAGVEFGACPNTGISAENCESARFQITLRGWVTRRKL